MRGSIAVKLTAIITVSMVVVFGAASIINLGLQERAAMRILRLNGTQIAELVAGATRDAMLHNDRTRIQETIVTLARQREIKRIRIMSKNGTIAYSTEPEEIGSRLNRKAEPCIVCHSGPTPPEALPRELRVRVLKRHVLGITETIPNDPDCSSAACHVHTPSRKLLGVLGVDLDLEPYAQARKESAREMTLAMLVGIVLLVGVTVVSVQRMVNRPVRKLIKETKRVASGDLSARVPEVSRDEIGALARTFNRMARELEMAREELLEWGRTLEARVQEKTQELERARDQILQVEKMASLGKLAAVVAHEINNPLASVVTYAKLLVRRLKNQELTEECRENLEYLESVASEATRCGEIVSQLLAFARRTGGEFSPTDINEVVEKALFLVRHKMELSNVTAETSLQPDLPPVVADASQIQQALMALLINACQAMEGSGGKVDLATRAVEGGAEIEVADTGPGMPPEVARRAFEPFFTTKEQGGVGLGLSVVYGIVERHRGNIDLDTALGRGCRFTLFFPENPHHLQSEEGGDR